MALPKYLYYKTPKGKYTYIVKGEDKDHWIVVTPARISVRYFLMKHDPNIIGTGEEPLPLADGSKRIPTPKYVFVRPGQTPKGVSATSTPVVEKWMTPKPPVKKRPAPGG